VGLGGFPILPLVLTGAAWCATAAPVAAPAPAAVRDPIISALEPELERGFRGLKLPGQPVPYQLSLSVIDFDRAEIVARLGDLVTDERKQGRYLHVRVRVGSPELDNTNYLGNGMWGGRGSMRTTAFGTDPGPVLRDSWQAADAAYKRSLESLAAKVAALKREQRTDRPPDFSAAAPVTHMEEAARFPDAVRSALADAARKATEVFRKYPSIQRGEASGNLWAATLRYLDTDGFRNRQSSVGWKLILVAETQARDGASLRDVYAGDAPLTAAGVPVEALVKAAREMAARLDERTRAPNLEDPYLGPVLFSAAAAAEFARQTLAGDLSGTPSPVASEDYMKAYVKGGQLARFLGQRILPAWMDVTDDPERAEWGGTPLLGRSVVDREGVRCEKVELVCDGRLRTFLMSRTPSDKVKATNGHGFIVAGNLVKASPSNLILTARKTRSWDALVAELVRLAREDGLPYALIVRHIDEPPGSDSGPRRISIGTGEESAEEAPSRWAISPALDIVKVDTSTRQETRVRGALFGPIGIAELKDIVAAGNDSAVYSLDQDPDVTDYYQGHAESTGVSIVAPSLLFAQLEVRPLGKKRRPMPFLESPLDAGTGP